MLNMRLWTRRLGSWARVFALLAVLAGALVVLTRLAGNWSRLVDEQLTLRWEFLVLALLVIIAQVLLLAVGWHMLLRKLSGLHIGLARTVRATATHCLASTCPAGSRCTWVARLY